MRCYFLALALGLAAFFLVVFFLAAFFLVALRLVTFRFVVFRTAAFFFVFLLAAMCMDPFPHQALT